MTGAGMVNTNVTRNFCADTDGMLTNVGNLRTVFGWKIIWLELVEEGKARSLISSARSLVRI